MVLRKIDNNAHACGTTASGRGIKKFTINPTLTLATSGATAAPFHTNFVDDDGADAAELMATADDACATVITRRVDGATRGIARRGADALAQRKSGFEFVVQPIAAPDVFVVVFAEFALARGRTAENVVESIMASIVGRRCVARWRATAANARPIEGGLRNDFSTSEKPHELSILVGHVCLLYVDHAIAIFNKSKHRVSNGSFIYYYSYVRTKYLFFIGFLMRV